MNVTGPEAVPLSTFEQKIGGRENNFDFLRFLLATLVLFYHCFPLLYGAGERTPSWIERAASYGGGSAVDFFFVISGFLITQSWERTPQAGRFLQKRILRIYPAFILVSLFCALVVGPLGAADLKAYLHHFHPAGFVAYMLLLVGPYLPPVLLTVPYPGQVDGSFWTLRYEFECYLLVLALGLTGLILRRSAVAALLVCVFLLSVTSLSGYSLPLPDREFHVLGNPTKWIRLALFFLVGMTFYLFRERVRNTPLLLVLSAAAVILGMIFPKWQVPTLAVAGSYLLLWFAFLPIPRLARFARYGDFSYGIYLFAFPVQQLLVRSLRPVLTPLLLFCLALLVSLLLAAVSWHFVEAPALRLKRRGSSEEALSRKRNGPCMMSGRRRRNSSKCRPCRRPKEAGTYFCQPDCRRPAAGQRCAGVCGPRPALRAALVAVCVRCLAGRLAGVLDVRFLRRPALLPLPPGPAGPAYLSRYGGPVPAGVPSRALAEAVKLCKMSTDCAGCRRHADRRHAALRAGRGALQSLSYR